MEYTCGDEQHVRDRTMYSTGDDGGGDALEYIGVHRNTSEYLGMHRPHRST